MNDGTNIDTNGDGLIDRDERFGVVSEKNLSRLGRSVERKLYNKRSQKRKWNKYEFQWEKEINGVWVKLGSVIIDGSYQAKVWVKDTEAKPKKTTDKEFVVRWIQHMKADKTLSQFCRGWNYPKKKALDRVRRLNQRFNGQLKPLKRLKKPAKIATDEEISKLITKLLS